MTTRTLATFSLLFLLSLTSLTTMHRVDKLLRNLEILDSLSTTNHVAPRNTTTTEVQLMMVEPSRYVCIMTAKHPLIVNNPQEIKQSNNDDCQSTSSSSSVCGVPYMGSNKLFKTNNPHGRNTSWLVRIIHGIPSDLPQALVQTLKIRFQRYGLDYNPQQNMTMINNVLERDGFTLVIVDSNDIANYNQLHGYLRRKIKPIIGWQHTYLITRTITASPYRDMSKYNQLPWKDTVFEQRALGGITNFTKWVGNLYRGVKHYTYPIRNDLYDALESTLLQRQQELSELLINNNMTTVTSQSQQQQQQQHQQRSQSQHHQDPYVHFPGRIKDVISFWKPGDTSYSSNLRSAVSETIQELGRREQWKPAVNYYTDIVGYRDAQGRQSIHPDYIQALLQYKIVVLCQRDHFEDQIRFFEAMISGALVLSDPMNDMPRDIQDGTNIVIYHSLEDLQQKILYYLAHEAERQQIATQGRHVALKQHRSWHRWEALLLDDWAVMDNNSISILD